MSSLRLVCLSFLLKYVFCQPEPVIQHFSDGNGGALRNLLLVDSHVLVGSQSRLYQLDAQNLTLKRSVNITTANRLLLLLNDTGSGIDDVLSCQQSNCLLISSSSLVQKIVSLPDNVADAASSLVPGGMDDLTGIALENDRSFFVAREVLNTIDNDVVSTVSKISYMINGGVLDLSLIGKQVEASLFFERKFLTIFKTDSFVYLVFELDAPNPNRLYFVRLCNDDPGLYNNADLTTYTEVKLECSGISSDSITITAATPIIINNHQMVLVATSSEVDDSTSNHICLFNVTEINEVMNDRLDQCVAMVNNVYINDLDRTNTDTGNPCGSSNLPVSSCFRPGPFALPLGVPDPVMGTSVLSPNSSNAQSFNSLISFSYENITYVLAGVGGNVEQYYYSDSALIYIQAITVTTDSTVDELHWSTAHEFFYAVSPSSVALYPINVCTQYTTCSTCTQYLDPLCGWCTLTNRCTKLGDCITSPQVWVNTDTDCPIIESVDPAVLAIHALSNNNNANFTIKVRNIPNVAYDCVYMFGEKEVTPAMPAAIIISNTTVICLPPSSNDLSSFGDGYTLSARFSLRISSSIEVIVSWENVQFINCSQALCSKCVSASGMCGWCQLDFSCTEDYTTCTGGASNWLTISTSESPTDVCPFLVANNGVDDYTQPITVSDDLPLMTLNTPDISDLTYQCVFDNSVTITAVHSSDTSIECQVAIGQLSSTMNTDTVDFTLRQVYNGQIYNLETNGSADINVVLYDCPSLADSCSQCLGQNIGTGFNCGWCSNAGQCNVATQCSNNELVTMSGGCGQPMITGISPTTGSPEGQTTITINGTNLGVKFSDIVSVMVGSRTCNSIESQYRTGVRIVCTISTDGVNPVGTANITVTINTSGGQIPVTSNQFTVLEPVIESVRPDIGPVSGGTVVTIRGMNLDVGNKQNTRVLFREAVGNRKRRQSCPEIECDIDDSLFNSTYLSCESAAGGSSDCVMSVVVDINNDEISNNAVRFQYTPDPVFTSVTPQDIIPAGGIRVVFTGTNLNVTQSPIIRITDSRLQTTEGPCSTSSSDQFECVVPMLSSSSSSLSNVYGNVIQYSILVDGASGPDYNTLALTLRPNPSITGVIINEIDLPLVPEEVIRIRGFNLTDSLRDQITITVGEYNCPISTVSKDANEISCSIPNIIADMELFVKVNIGFLSFGDMSDVWKVSFAAVIAPASSAIGIALGVVGATIFVILLISLIAVVAFLYSRSKLSQTVNPAEDAVRFDDPDNLVVRMSQNIVYQGMAAVHSQPNPVYTAATASSQDHLHIYEEIPNKGMDEVSGDDDSYVNEGMDKPPSADDIEDDGYVNEGMDKPPPADDIDDDGYVNEGMDKPPADDDIDDDDYVNEGMDKPPSADIESNNGSDHQ